MVNENLKEIIIRGIRSDAEKPAKSSKLTPVVRQVSFRNSSIHTITFSFKETLTGGPLPKFEYYF